MFNFWKVNARPKNVDDQEIPRKLRNMLKLKEDVEKMKAERKVKRLNKDPKEEVSKVSKDLLDSTRGEGVEVRLPGMKRPLRPVPVFKQKEGETERRFINR